MTLDEAIKIWVALSDLRTKQAAEKQECYIVIHQNYADDSDAYAFWSEEKAVASIWQDTETVIADLKQQGYSPRFLYNITGGAIVYVPDTDIYYDWVCVPSHIE